jgi:putative transposase
MKLRKFIIDDPEDYPYIDDTNYQLVETDSWFDIVEENHNKNYQFKAATLPVNKTVIRSRKVQLYPTNRQKKILKQWIDLSTYTYNQTILLLRLNSDGILNSNSDKKNYSWMTFRNKYKKHIIEKNLNLKTSKIPSHTIDNAIKDVFKAFKTAMANLKAKNISYFRLRYQKIQKNKKTLTIEGSAFSKKNNTFCPTILGDKIKSSYPIQGIKKDCKLSYDSGKFYLYVPYEKNVEKIATGFSVGIDPGIRTFMSGYSNGGFFKIGNDPIKELGPILERIDKIDTDKHKFKTNSTYKKVRSKYANKLKNKVADMHWKAARYVCSNHETILIGKLSTKGIVSNDRSTLTKMTKRMTYALSHYTFRQRLLSKAEDMGVKVYEVDESYTSKTCGWCSEINSNLGSSKYFECRCGYGLDRDYHGARNILIKNQLTIK